jgi:hypothetical protein
MANTIRHKRNSTPGATPGAGTLVTGELAINTADGKLFTKKENGTVVEIGAGGDGITSVVGTSGEINVSTSGSTVTLSLPNNISARGMTTATGLAFDAGADQTIDFSFDGGVPLITIDHVFGVMQVRTGSGLAFFDADESHYVGFMAPSAITQTTLWTLPTADGSVNQVLTTNGAGALSWSTPSGSGGSGVPDFVLFNAGII